MSKMIQIRNVPDDLHKKLKIRAAREGISLSDLLLREAARVAERPTMEEISERIERRIAGRKGPARPLGEEIVRIIREDRGPPGSG